MKEDRRTVDCFCSVGLMLFSSEREVGTRECKRFRNYIHALVPFRPFIFKNKRGWRIDLTGGSGAAGIYLTIIQMQVTTVSIEVDMHL